MLLKPNTPNTFKEKECECIRPANCPYSGLLNGKYCQKYLNYLEGFRTFQYIAPKSFSNVSFENFTTYNQILKDALKKSIYFVNKQLWKKGSGLILYGGYGTGKTRLGYTILKEIAIMGGIIEVIDLITDFEKFETADEKIIQALKAEVIFIDDLGAKSYNWIAEKIRIIVDEATRNRKSIIISSNLKPDKLVTSLDDRTASRLTELIPKQGIIYRGEEDFRIKKRKEKEIEWLEYE